MNLHVICASGLFSMMFLSLSVSISEAQIETFPLGAAIGLQKTVLTLHIPEDNKLPWAFIEGKVSNPAPGYPVIIQIYDDGLTNNGNDVGAVHFAQIMINPNDTFEYKFRVADMRDGKLVNIFEGDYTVKIFKVVYIDFNFESL